jgi:D-alanine--poly(phosphoribitol) ligase subunit 1
MDSAVTPESRIHCAVARHARSTPDATALIGSGHRISYRELDAAANFYAAELDRHGVRPGQVIPVLVQRSPQLIALQLGILKCGAAYANLDSRWPAERLAAILEQLSPTIAVAADSVDLGRFPVYRPPFEDLAITAAAGAEFSPVMVDDRAPAVVFFTSGTSGSPKGIVAPHRAATRLFGPGRMDGFGPGHVTPQAAALPWDMSAFELWGQLTTGGACALPDNDYLLPDDLRDLVAGAAADVMWLTSSLFNVLVDEDPGCFDGMKRIYVGGEAPSPAHARSFIRRHPGIVLQNGYGPAESCMLTTTHIISDGDCDLPGGIPMGTPLPGTQVLLLDADDQKCAVGRAGEICIAGDGLAIGYLNDPRLTAEKFPTVEIDGKQVRIYRTGDMGIMDGSGIFHYRGRNDRQIKMHGHRIELSEIEAATRSLSGVRDCAAVPVFDDGQIGRLALFYISDPVHFESQANRHEDPLAVGRWLSEKLPPYTVPAVVRQMGRFPVTANGKLDRRALERLANDG